MEEGTGPTRFARNMAETARHETPIWTTECLEPDDLIALIEQGADSSEALHRMAHVASCAYCRQEFETMEATLRRADRAMRRQASAPAPSVRPAAPPPFWRSLFAPAVGFALGSAVVGGIVYTTLVTPLKTQIADARRRLREQQTVLARRPSDPSGASTTRSAATPPPSKTLQAMAAEAARARRENAQLRRESAQQATRIAALTKSLTRNATPGDETLALDGLKRAFELTRQANGVLSESQRTMGDSGSEPPAFRVVRPVAQVLPDNQITFQWEPVASAVDYVVVVLDSSFHEVVRSRPMGQRAWRTRLPRPAARALAYYEWYVLAHRLRGHVERSAPAKFAMLDSRNLLAELKASQRSGSRGTAP